MYLCRFIVVISILQYTQGLAKWTRWHDTDQPSHINGDDVETLARIRQVDRDICHESVQAECRIVGQEDLTFSNEVYFKGNRLSVPCNKEGVACYLEDQDFGQTCSNYQVRFQCFQQDIKPFANNTGFIALAASCSIIIPLVCVLAIQLKKARVAQAAARSPALTADNPDTFDAPPSYTQLFGRTNGAVDQRSRSTDELLNSSDINQSNSTLETISGCNVSDVSIENGVNYSYQQNSSRHPGMHISITDLLIDNNNTYIQSETTPPPSYDEALEILKSAPKKE